MHYRPEIDGLRALAVLPVILFHAGFELFSGGFVGVDIFFVISGYLITTIILSEMDKGVFSLKHFYERRARRILPALFLVMACSVPFAWMWLSPEELKGFWKSLGAVSTFSSNFLFLKESGYFDTEAELKPLLHTWSLAVEEQYYILFPLFIISTWNFGKKHIIALLLFIFIFIFIAAHWSVDKHPDAAFYLLPTRGWEILLGAFAAFAANIQLIPKLSRLTEQLFSTIGLILIMYSVFAFDKNLPFPSAYTLIPTSGALLLILFANNHTLSHRILCNKIAVGIGLISYSAYLWHQPIFSYTRHVMNYAPPPLLMALLCLLTFLLAFFSWLYIEKPFRSKQSIDSKAILKFSVITTVIFIIIGLSGYLKLIPGYDKNRLTRSASQQTAVIERGRAVKKGICHFSKNKGPELDKFLADWRCYSDDENLLNSGLLVYGDSHAADKAIALAQNGVDVIQITGAGCPLTQQTKERDPTYCKSLFSLATQQNTKRVILANRFKVEDLNREHLVDIFSFWSQNYDEVILFTPMPNFKYAVKNYIFFDDPSLSPTIAEHTLFKVLVSTISVPSNFIIIDTYQLFCGDDGEDCKVASNGDWLMTDYGHLSVKGAKIFGSRLKSSKYSHHFFK